ncbi:YciI family protein [Marinomonas algicola]|uniref:YciI family protein n=1 Tax=Marinomonas algicola TaxID=2773454 RepID=UPI00174A747A|nr:YciI family protein [Marinomonas algicola]
MLYSIVGEDHPNSLADRAKSRAAHLERLHTLQSGGKLILAGPNPMIDSNDPGEAGFSGSIIIAEFDSLEAAQAWASEDPYLAAGVYKNVTVKPFKQVLPA